MPRTSQGHVKGPFGIPLCSAGTLEESMSRDSSQGPQSTLFCSLTGSPIGKQGWHLLVMSPALFLEVEQLLAAPWGQSWFPAGD